MDSGQKPSQDTEPVSPFLCKDGVTERPFLDVPVPWYAKVVRMLLSGTKLPSSLALLPDGNRRWAKQRNMTPQEGHDGAVILVEQVLAVAFALGVTKISVQLFSLHNFMRREDQQRHLFSILSRFFDSITKNWKFYQQRGLSVKVSGDLELLPQAVYKRAATTELTTHQMSGGSQMIICAPYESRHQITRMALTLCHAVKNGRLEPGDITERLIDCYNDIEDGPVVDCYLRTSGERRLSDFLTWQSERSFIYFAPMNFPNFAFWDIFKMLLLYSASSSSRKRLENCYLKARNDKEQKPSAAQRMKERKFQSWLETKRQAYLQRLAEE